MEPCVYLLWRPACRHIVAALVMDGASDPLDLARFLMDGRRRGLKAERQPASALPDLSGLWCPRTCPHRPEAVKLAGSAVSAGGVR